MSELEEGEEQQVIEEEPEDPNYVCPIMDPAILASSLKKMDLIAGKLIFYIQITAKERITKG